MSGHALLITLFLSTFAISALAQQGDTDGEDTESLDLFDGDAEETESGWSQFTASMGYMWLDADGSFDVEVPSGERISIIDLDRLGIDDDTGTIWATLNWRSRSSKWGAWFGYWSFSGAGFRVWEDELILDDEVVVPVGAGVATEITTDWYILEATYSFVHTETWDVGVGFGLHVVDIDTALAVAARVGDETRTESVVNLDTLAPLPNFLGFAHYRFGEKWDLTARMGWFGLSYEEYDGEMLNFHGLVRYNINDRWAAEVGYQFVELDVDVNEDFYTGIFDMDFEGPMAVFRFNF
ncbi:MAG: hypothetical protein AAGH19_07670 [Pseudomonadota bacterium]